MDIEAIKWIATLSMAMGALLVSISVHLSSLWWPYMGFLIGHILWTFAALWAHEIALLTLNVIFIIIDLYAILLRLNIIRRNI